MISAGRVPKRRVPKGFILGLSAAVVAIFLVWIGIVRLRQHRAEIEEPLSQDVPSAFERKNIDAMGIDELKTYIMTCERARDFQESERAYQRAIDLTQGEKSQFKEFIEFNFGLAELYLNSLWEYGQFGGGENIPPALQRAIRIYDEIIASYPDSELAAEAQFRKGELFHNELSGYWNSLHRDDAIREFQKVIEHYPGTEQAKKAKKMLSLLETGQ